MRKTIYTAPEQIAVASGALLSHSKENNRAKFVYQNNTPHYWAPVLASANYTQTKAQWQFNNAVSPVEIEILHHPNHAENVPLIIAEIKSALSFGTELWGRFPFDSIKVVESPNGMNETIINGNLIIIPEQQVWLHDYRNPPELDWIAFQIHRDITKVWWSSAAIDKVPGHVLFAEAMPTLVGLYGVESKHNEPAMKAIVNIFQDNYLRDRTTEEDNEASLVNLDEEIYAENKAVLTLVEIRNLIGSEAFFNILTTYYQDVITRQTGQYANIEEFKQRLLRATPNRQLKKELEVLFIKAIPEALNDE